MIDWDKKVLGPLNKVFGEAVTYQPTVGSSFSINGIFDEAYRELSSVGDGIGMTTEMPVLGVQMSSFSVAPKQGDQLIIVRTGVTYVVKEVRDDGHGEAKLMLNFVSA